MVDKSTRLAPGARAQERRDPSETSLSGQVLIAMPNLTDSKFTRSVIFMCAHTDEGAMGIVINRPLNAPRFADLLKQLEVSPAPPAREIRLCDGGPVDKSRGFVLHTADWKEIGRAHV